jgi:hypothetical protein
MFLVMLVQMKQVYSGRVWPPHRTLHFRSLPNMAIGFRNVCFGCLVWFVWTLCFASEAGKGTAWVDSNPFEQGSDIYVSKRHEHVKLQ